MTEQRSATLMLFAGAALISLSPVWVTLTSVPPTVSGFYRMVIGGGALAIYLVVTRRRLALSRHAWALLIAAALFFAADLWCWHRSIVYVGPGLATLLGNLQVFFMMLAGVAFLHQRPSVAQWIAMPLAIAGLTLIVGIDWRALPADNRLGIVFGLLTAFTYSGYLLTLRAARARSSHRSAAREIAVVSLITAVLLGLAALTEGASLAIPTAADAGWLLGYGILSHCAGWLLIAGSLPRVSVTQAGLALLLQPTLSYLWEVLLFARVVTLTELVGAVVVLAAIYLGSR